MFPSKLTSKSTSSRNRQGEQALGNQAYGFQSSGLRNWLNLARALGFLLLVPLTSEAQINPLLESFPKRVLKFEAKAGDPAKLVQWEFINRGELPLMIAGFDLSCGCLKGKESDQIVKPGQEGVVEGFFEPGPFRGLLKKSIHVRFGGYDKPVELSVEVVIASSVEISSRDLYWLPGADLDTKTLEVTTGTGAPFEITGLVGASEKNFKIERSTIQEGTHYQLEITPLHLDSPMIEGLQVRTNSKDPRDRILPVFLHRGLGPKKLPVKHQDSPSLPR